MVLVTNKLNTRLLTGQVSNGFLAWKQATRFRMRKPFGHFVSNLPKLVLWMNYLVNLSGI